LSKYKKKIMKYGKIVFVHLKVRSIIFERDKTVYRLLIFNYWLYTYMYEKCKKITYIFYNLKNYDKSEKGKTKKYAKTKQFIVIRTKKCKKKLNTFII